MSRLRLRRVQPLTKLEKRVLESWRRIERREAMRVLAMPSRAGSPANDAMNKIIEYTFNGLFARTVQ